MAGRLSTSRPARVGLALLAAGLAAATPGAAGSAELRAASDDTSVLDAAFRIDIRSIDAVFDIYPSERRAQARAVLHFRMRTGQTRPLIHLEPARLPGAAVALRLDGKDLDVGQTSDVRIVRFPGSPQLATELQRDLSPKADHVLELAYPVPMTDYFGRFFTDVNDLLGRGNEGLFPGLNTPHELARHLITLRVHAAEPYVMVGSGRVTHKQTGDVQEWMLDTEREVASYTVLFYLAPARDSILAERRVQGVDVRVLAAPGGPTPDEAFAQLDPWLAELKGALGPFPMPRGLSVVLTSSGGGMEYYGGTISSLPALRHEVFHMYYGCSTVAKTYRDSWWDEAINMWYQLSADPAFPAIHEDFRSDIVSGRSPIGIGFDRRAYAEGAQIIQAVARDLGGRSQAVAFLRELHLARSFDPFSSRDLAEEIRVRRGVDVRDRFERWLYTGGVAGGTAAASAWQWLHQVDTTPPEAVRRHYDH
jgi:hypothetical protein